MIPLPMNPGEMPKAPSREQVEEQSVRWAYLARKAMLRNDSKTAEMIGSVLQPALAGYAEMYGAEAGEALRRAMSAAGERADRELSRKVQDDKRRVALIVAALAAALVLVIATSGRCSQPADSDPGPAAGSPAPKPARKKPPAISSCGAGQTSSYNAETGTYSCHTSCPQGQSVVVSDGAATCGCPGGQVYNDKAKTCETPN